MGYFEDWDIGKDRNYLRNKIGTILGGVPNNHDFIPSVICVVLYALLFIPIAYRLRNKTLSFSQVWRPLIVILTRIASFAIRIKLSEGQNWNKDLFVAELVLLRISPILLTSALISLFREAVVPYLPQKDSPRLNITIPLQYFVSFLQMITYFCLGLTIAIAFDVKQAINGNAEAKIKLHRSKEISIYMLLAVNGIIYLLSGIPLVMLSKNDYNHNYAISKEKEITKFTSLLAVCTFLLVVAGFKAAQLASHGLATRIEIIINKKILFYGVCVTGEYIACALFALLAWNVIVPQRESLDSFFQIKAGGEPEPSMAEDRRGSSFNGNPIHCPTYTQQAGNLHQSTQYSQHGGPFVETRPYADKNMNSIQAFHPPLSSSYYTPNKRGSTQTLSTISEVRYSSPIKTLPFSNGIAGGGGGGGGGGGEGKIVEGRRHTSELGNLDIDTASRSSSSFQQSRTLSAPWLYPSSIGNNNNQVLFNSATSLQPPPSATESVKSHWSDDSEDDKKGFSVALNLVKSTRDSLTRKSSKGSKTSSHKGDKSI